MPENKNYLSLQEASTLIGRSYWTLREDIIAGRLSAVRFTPRGKFYLKPDDIEAFIDRSRCKAVGE
jgi:hypothetical protein